jgi:hypothetical protein
VSFAALVTLSIATTLTGCGSKRHADDDEDSSAGQAGGGSGGGSGRGGNGGSQAEGGEGGHGGEGGVDSGGEAGSEASAGRGGKGNAGRGGAGGTGGAAGRGGGSAGKGGGSAGRGGGAGAAGGDAGTGADAGTAGVSSAGSSGSGGSGSGIVTFLMGEYRESLSDATSYLFDDVNLANAAPDRLVVVAAHSATNVVASFSSVTIGGIAALKVASVGENVQPSAPTAFYTARVPTGTQADIQVEMSAGVVRAAIAVYALYGVQSATAYDSGTLTAMGGGTIPSLEVAAGGVVLSGLGMADVANADAMWADMFELYDVVMVEGTPTHVSGALRVASATSTAFDVTVSSPTAGYVTRAVAVSFR